MVGNDIVDLGLANRNVWKRKRYLDKVLVPSEQEMLFGAEDPGTFFWMLWSMKESAYKLHFRKNLIRALNPTSFTCFVDEGLKGRVEVGTAAYHTHTMPNQHFVHTVAREFEYSADLSTDEVSADSSSEVRQQTLEALIHSFSCTSNYDPQHIHFVKDKHGLPFLTHELSGINKACSISHHGKYGAYAIVLQS